MTVKVTPRSNDIVLSVNLYQEAAKKGMTFSQYLESVDPSSEYGAGEQLDAYERQLKRFDIRVVSDPARGLYADTVEKFYTTDDSKVLFPEFIKRSARQDMLAGPVSSEFIALTTPINSSTYDSLIIEDQPEEQQLRRTTEKARLPVIKLETKDNSIRTKTYGAVIEATYKAIRHMRLDLLAIHLQMIGQQADVDKAADILDVIINGDGNSNPATNYNVNTLDPAAAGKLTYLAWLSWLFNFYPHTGTTVAANKAELLQILTLQMPNLNPMTILSMLQNGQPFEMRVQLAQNVFTTVRLVYLPSAPANVLAGIDKRYGIEQVTEIGSDITETARIIASQYEQIAVSEALGFSKLLNKASKTLTLGV